MLTTQRTNRFQELGSLHATFPSEDLNAKRPLRPAAYLHIPSFAGSLLTSPAVVVCSTLETCLADTAGIARIHTCWEVSAVVGNECCRCTASQGICSSGLCGEYQDVRPACQAPWSRVHISRGQHSRRCCGNIVDDWDDKARSNSCNRFTAMLIGCRICGKRSKGRTAGCLRQTSRR